MKKIRHSHEQGFSIVELMIATTVFSVVLLLCATAIIQVGRMYYKGVIVSRTEDVSRKVIEDLAQAVQFKGDGQIHDSGLGFAGSPPVRALCIGSVRYVYARPDFSLSDNGATTSRHVLWKDRMGAQETCNTTGVNMSIDTPSAGGQELLSGNMRVVELSATPSGEGWAIKATIAYGEDAALYTVNNVASPNAFAQCVNSNSGGQFCAVSALNTLVTERL
jgi:prepilin-type N-terminal cleavage/methylation domain-containing protein